MEKSNFTINNVSFSSNSLHYINNNYDVFNFIIWCSYWSILWNTKSQYLKYAVICIFVPIFAISTILCHIFKTSVSFYLRLKYKSDFKGLLLGSDAVWATEGVPRSIINVILKIKTRENSDLREFETNLKCFLQTTFFDNAESHPKLTCALHRFLGYNFLVKSNFPVEECVTSCNEFKDVYHFLTNNPYKHLPRDNRVLWEVILFELNRGEIAILFRVSHIIGDGASLIQLFINTFTDSTIEYPFSNRPFKERSLLNTVKTLCDLPTNVIYKNLLRTRDINALHPSILSGKKLFASAVEEENRRLIEAVKAVKRITQVSFMDVLLTAVSASFCKHFRKTSRVLPRYVTSAVPAFGIEVGESGGLKNRFSIALLKIPILIESNSLLERLRKVKVEFDALKMSNDYQVNSLLLSIFSGLIPSPVLKRLLNMDSFTMTLSNMPGIPRMSILNGNLVSDVVFFTPQRGTAGVGITALTYDNRFQLGLSVDEAIVSSVEECREILDDFSARYARGGRADCQGKCAKMKADIPTNVNERTHWPKKNLDTKKITSKKSYNEPITSPSNEIKRTRTSVATRRTSNTNAQYNRAGHSIMFNLYQNINKKDEPEKESDVIGHERYYQARSRSLRKKKKAPRRTRSAAEFNPAALTAAHRRVAFGAVRSRSSENRGGETDAKATPPRVESLTKLFFGKRSQSPVRKHEYSALKTDGGCEKFKIERQIRNGAFVACRNNLENNDRYELKTQLDDIDNNFGAERLLALLPLPSGCPISPSPSTRDTLLALFGSLQHPYIHPVFDVDFWDAGAAVVSPLNPAGSLKDLIYGTIQCLGRQILEGLLFLRNRYFLPIYHLHSGNVIIQNGVARLAGLENHLLGMAPRAPSAPETLSFGYLLFEMTAGYELTAPPTPAHLQLELDKAPKVAETIEFVFRSSGTPTLDELVRCDLFRGVELRELRGAGVSQSAAPPDVLDLLEAVKNPAPASPLRRKDVVVVIEDRRLEDIIEEDNEDSDCNSVIDNNKNR
ncbi:unnamed protein product [Phyllotreta striolata]|uniref:O-acyltransferase WSD1 C-terminal domain-containing protein n=1 Tax=Phyllotreta striolata TaxID=444603 RepID=A0A9N9TKU8_PHYSR|nr:unnamed protein product [Phyllotreta striolata]